MLLKSLLLGCVLSVSSLSVAGVLEYGTENVLGTGTYASDPKAGTILVNLAPGTVTYSSLITPHGFPFTPAVGDFQGTDQIYVGSAQTGVHDGYSQSTTRIAGPDVITMDYSSIVPLGQQVTSITLGIAADDFQNAVFGQPFTASINGVVNTGLTSVLNGLNETGPVVQFLTYGLDTSSINALHKLTLTIDEGGDGGDGYAVDFLTIGVTTQKSSVPAPAAILPSLLGMIGISVRRRRNARA